MRINYSLLTKSTLAIFSMLFLFSSCQKEKNADDGCTTTMATVAGTYKLTALKYKPSATASEIDYMPLREDCEQDDLIDLNTNGTYTYRDMGTKCSPDGTDNGIWSIAGNTIVSDGIVAGTIQSFDCKKLVLYTSDFMVPGDKITLTIEKQ